MLSIYPRRVGNVIMNNEDTAPGPNLGKLFGSQNMHMGLWSSCHLRHLLVYRENDVGFCRMAHASEPDTAHP